MRRLLKETKKAGLDADVLPQAIEKAVKKLDSMVFYESEWLQAANIPLSSKASVQAFPECMQSLYGKIASGESLSHMERFFLACFLVKARMPTEEIVVLFKNAPNFNEKTTRYHVNNIKKKGYAPPTREKLRMHSIQCNCNKGPFAEYLNNLRKLKLGSKTAKPDNKKMN